MYSSFIHCAVIHGVPQRQQQHIFRTIQNCLSDHSALLIILSSSSRYLVHTELIHTTCTLSFVQLIVQLFLRPDFTEKITDKIQVVQDVFLPHVAS